MTRRSKIAPDTPAAQLILWLGGSAEVARQLGHRNITTVYGWFQSGNIPDWRKAELRDLLRRKRRRLPKHLRGVLDATPSQVSLAPPARVAQGRDAA